MTKIFNFAFKIKGVGREGGTCEVLRPCHPPKFETCTLGSNRRSCTWARVKPYNTFGGATLLFSSTTSLFLLNKPEINNVLHQQCRTV